GATDVDNNGIAGAEARFDEDLRASTEPVRLSLDLRVQHAVHRVLRESIDYFKADAGVGVVADVRTGELISMVSLPDFEPERYGDADKNAQFNRATLGVYELGSVFKVVNNAMGLDAGLTPDDGFDATHPIKISRFTINDFHGKGRWLNLTEIMTYSSNIGSAKLAMAVGAEGQQAFLRRLGLLDPLPLELPERARPLQPSIWRDVNTMTISYGHGLSVTPVHLVSAVSGLVNDGIRIPPTLLARTPDQAAPYGERVLSQEHSMALRGMMRSVVEEGSGKQADVKGYFVGGKTGSAEKESATGGYSRHDLRTSFIAAFPLDEPAYVVLVMLDSPKGLKETYNFATAGWNAAPTVGRMIAEIAPLLGVTPRPTPYPNLLDPATLNEARLETQTDNLHIATARADEGGAGVAR
ncbi:MAG: peptidoglycan D,D-transpeptidase FtsI family protein, partial [Rhodospirillaceae bacterium]